MTVLGFPPALTIAVLVFAVGVVLLAVVRLGGALLRRHRGAPVTTSHLEPGARGFTFPGGGAMSAVTDLHWWRATAVQLAGLLYPFSIGGTAPRVGVPLGPGVNCDPLSWFQIAKFIHNPSAGLLGIPGVGKSTVLRRWALFLHGFGNVPVVLGDIKGEYVAVTEAMRGDVLPVGPGRGSINICDLGSAPEAAERLWKLGTREAVAEAQSLLADARAQRTTLLASHLTILRSGTPPEDWEEGLCAAALSKLDDRLSDRPPLVQDLLTELLTAQRYLLDAADAATPEHYRDMIRPLVRSLRALLGEGRLGQGVFTQPTTARMRPGVPVCFDVSTIGDTQLDLQGAIMLAIYRYAFGEIRVAHALAKHGLGPQLHFFAILDELWRPLATGRGIVDRVNTLTRTNRTMGVAQVMAMHSLSDLDAVPTEADRAKARQMFARAGMLVCGGLPPDEMPLLLSVARFSNSEQERLMSWSAPGSMNPRTGRLAAPPGQGMFMIKVGRRDGIEVRVQLTPIELALNDTNELWHQLSGTMPITAPAATTPSGLTVVGDGG